MENRPKGAGVFAEECAPRGYTIKHQAEADDEESLKAPEVFMEHHQVVSEVQKRFPTVALGQGASTHMVYYR